MPHLFIARHIIFQYLLVLTWYNNVNKKKSRQRSNDLHFISSHVNNGKEEMKHEDELPKVANLAQIKRLYIFGQTRQNEKTTL